MKCFVSILMFTISFSVQAVESLSSKDAAKLLSTEVMESVSNNLFKSGLLKLRPYMVSPVAEFDAQMGQIDLQLPVIKQRFGRSIGYDFVDEERLGKSLVQFVYLQKFEKHAMVWRFVFLQAKG